MERIRSTGGVLKDVINIFSLSKLNYNKNSAECMSAHCYKAELNEETWCKVYAISATATTQER